MTWLVHYCRAGISSNQALDFARWLKGCGLKSTAQDVALGLYIRAKNLAAEYIMQSKVEQQRA